MNIPTNVKYTPNHEWIRVEGGFGYIGVSDFAQSQLGDIVFVEVETVGEEIEKGEPFGTIEAVKTVEDIYMPVTGKILEFNEKLESSPESINKDPYGEGWIVKVELLDATQLDELLDATAYAEIATAH
ncbi:MAG TPA: glycine cleavage system protein GcvH [Bacteroidales bacterium]|jgi:glycine cleavage system H protein|nr:glycine cleavage system protein GcvH [Bacteroidales bacterium]